MSHHQKSQMVYCLLVDLISSTTELAKLTEHGLECFNRALGRQLSPHLVGLELTDALVKFQGDGWLVMAHREQDVGKVAGLALILKERFRDEMQALLAEAEAPVPEDFSIPELRLILCSGNDTPIFLANGAGDFAANSGRRAARVPKKMANHQFIVDDATRQKLGNDFATREASREFYDAAERKEQVPWPLFIVEGLKPDAIAQSGWAYVRGCMGKQLKLKSSPDLRPALQGEMTRYLDLDFIFAWGGVQTKSVFNTEQVTIKWMRDIWTPPAVVGPVTLRAMYERVKIACDDNHDFRFRPLGRVATAEVSESGDSLELHLQPTMYGLFAATNLNLDKHDRCRGKAGLEFASAVELWRENENEEARQPFLASALNVIGCVVSNDNCVIIPKRSSSTHEKGGTYQASTGGFVEAFDGEGIAAAKTAFTREVEEELGLSGSDLQVKFVGFGYNGPTGEPDLIAYAIVPLMSGEQMRGAYQERRQKVKKVKNQKDELEPDVKKLLWDLKDRARVVELARLVRNGAEWSQPSDRVAVVAALYRALSAHEVEAAFKEATR